MLVFTILKNWVSVCGAADRFLSDNGGEFDNESFLELRESLNSTV